METLLQKSHHKVEIINNDLNETISKVHEKLRRVDDTSSVKDWVYTLIEESTPLLFLPIMQFSKMHFLETEILHTNAERFSEIEEIIKNQTVGFVKLLYFFNKLKII